MNLFFKAALGIYIISVLLFSSLSKAEIQNDFVLNEDFYSLAVPSLTAVELINKEAQEKDQNIDVVSELDGTLLVQDRTLYFVSNNEEFIFEIATETIREFDIPSLPAEVKISGYYVKSQNGISSFNKVSPLHVNDILILN